MTVNTKTNGIRKSLAEISEVSNPNLLDNPDFRINMGGNSSYSKSGMTVNRWMLSSNDSITITPKSNGGINFNAPKASPTELYQKLETPIIGKATLSIKVSSISGELDYFVSGGTSRSIKTPGVYSITVERTPDNPITEVSIFAGTGGISTTADIDWVKLELGDNATSFVHPDYNEEYRKLLWYSRPIVNASRPAYVGGTGILYIPLPELATMRLSQPTVLYPNFDIYLYCNGSTHTIKKSEVDNDRMFVDNYKEICIYFKDSNRIIMHANRTCIVDFINNGTGGDSNVNGFWLDAELY